MVQYDCPYVDTSREYDVSLTGMHWDFDTAARKLETRVLVRGDDRETLDVGLDALRAHDNMNDFDLLSRKGNRALIRNRVGETDAMQTIRANDGYLTGPFEARAGSEVWHVGFDTTDVTDDALADLDNGNEFDVESRESISFEDYFDLVENISPARSLLEGCRALSSVEYETLERAHQSGYFETPRGVSLEQLGDTFDVSGTAVSKNLRRGERKIVDRVISAYSDLDSENSLD